MFYNMCLYHNLWITTLLFQLVSKSYDMTQPYITILRGSNKYSPMTRGWKHMGTWLLEIHNEYRRLLTWLYTMSIHLIWYYRHALVYFISITTIRDSLRHVSLHYIICTHYHLLVDPNTTYNGSRARQNF